MRLHMPSPRTLGALGIAAYLIGGTVAGIKICQPAQPRAENHADMACLKKALIAEGVTLKSDKFVLAGALVTGTMKDGTALKAIYSSTLDSFKLPNQSPELKRKFEARLEAACPHMPGDKTHEVVAAVDLTP